MSRISSYTERSTKRKVVINWPTEERRMISIVLESNGHGIYYPVTAYDADPKDIILYNRLKGGENNETDKN